MVSIRVLVILAFFLLLSFNLSFPTIARSHVAGIQSDSTTDIQPDSDTDNIPSAAALLAKPTEAEVGMHVEENNDGTNRGRRSEKQHNSRKGSSNSKSGRYKNLLQSNRRSSKSTNSGNGSSNNRGNGRNNENNRYNGNGQPSKNINIGSNNEGNGHNSENNRYNGNGGNRPKNINTKNNNKNNNVYNGNVGNNKRIK